MLFCLFLIRTKSEEDKGPKPRVVVCAANRNKVTGAIVCGARHFDQVMRSQINAITGDKQDLDWVGSEQGFIDNFGKFLTREEAHKIAYWNGQRKYRCGGDKDKLFSENLY